MNKTQRNATIIYDYQNGIYMKNLCIKYSLHRSTIQSILKSNNVKLHKNKSFIECNKTFFSQYTPESCYWAGFILADGNISVKRNSLQIKLALKDLDHIFKFAKSIECSEIDRIKKSKDSCKIVICLDEFKRDLNCNFNITPQKTYTCYITENIPRNLLSHFIRGYFDGDGCITITTTKSINFVGTKRVLEYLQKIFFDLGVKLKSKNKYPPIQNFKNNVGALHYSGKNSKIILDWIYTDSTENTRLSRKFEKYTILYKD